MPKALELAHGLAAGPRSLGLIRQMYWQGMENTYSDQLDLEAKLQSQAGDEPRLRGRCGCVP